MKYYVISLAGIVLLGFALTWSYDNKVKLVVALVSTFITLHLINLVVLVGAQKVNISNHQRRLTAAKQLGIPFDTREKKQVIDDLWSQGIDAYPRVEPALFIESNGLSMAGNSDRIYPLGGASNKTTVFCNETGEWVIYESDEHGFNNPKGIYNNQDVDIVLIGDSFTDGVCVHTEDTIAGQLRRDDQEVLNLGSYGGGPLIELATLKEYGEPFNPEIVLWVYYEGNDLSNLLVEQTSPLLLNYLDRSYNQELLARQTEIDQALMNYITPREEKISTKDESVFYSDIARILKFTDLRVFLGVDKQAPEDHPELALALFGRILAEARDRTAAWGGKLYFVYLPSWDRYHGNRNLEELNLRDEIIATVKELEIPVIDFHEVMLEHPDPLSLYPFRLFGHYTTEGYALLAQQIEAYLESDVSQQGK